MAEFRLGRVKFNWTGEWQPSKSYLIDDLIKFGGNSYVAVANHTSTASTADFYATDLSKWNVHIEGISSKGDWTSGVYYKVNDVVRFGNVQYRVTTAHTSAGTFIDLSKVTEYVAGFKAEGEWSINSQYQTGDVVNYQGSSYVALTTSLAGFSPPENVAIGTDTAGKKWQVLADGIAGAAITYTTGTYYRGQLVQYGGDIFRHKLGITTNIAPLSAGNTQGVGIGNSVWDLLVKGFNFVGNFSTTYAYHPGHVVRYGSNSYVSVGNSFQGVTPTAGLGTYWETLAAGDSSAVLVSKGDILTYNSGPFRIGIGSTGYALAVQDNGMPGYEIVGAQTRVYYVDSESGHDLNNGLAPNLAFKTIKKACAAARPQTPITGFNYTAATGVATITAPGHGLQNTGTFVQLEGVEFECLSGGNVFSVLGMQYNKTVGLATITAIGLGAAPEIGIGATVRIRNLQVQYTGDARFAHTFQSATSGAVKTGGNYAHTFIAANSGAINITSGSLNGSELTPTNASYTANSGEIVFTVGNHGLSIGDTLTIDDDSMTFTCAMDGNSANKTYPRSSDPARGSTLAVTAITQNTFTVNVGTSPLVTYDVSAATYDHLTGELVMDIGTHQLASGTSIKLADNSLIFRCAMDGYITDHSYPRSTDPYYDTAIPITATSTTTITVNIGVASSNTTITGNFPSVHTPGQYQFPVQGIPDANSIILNVGQSATDYLYVQSGTAFVGLTTTVYPDKASKSYFEVLEVPDVDTFRVNVGVSTINHTYVKGGLLTDLTPAILRLSASQFYEQLPIIVPPFTSIVGHTLRGTQVLPAAGFSDDGTTPNNRSTMFKLSDGTTVQALAFKGMEGFHYDPNAPLEMDNTNLRTGIGTTAAGVFFALNPNSPINNKSPYVKDCTTFSDPATDFGRFGGGGVGVFIDGGVHSEGAKSMVFDAFTQVNSDGAGFLLDKSAIAEIVSCFSYYAKWGYYSGGGARIRAVGGNNSYGDYGVISSGFSSEETARTARLFGDLMTILGTTVTGTVAVGNTITGQSSGAQAWLVNDQKAADKFYFKYHPGYGQTAAASNGNVAIGTSPFIDGELVYAYQFDSGASYGGSFTVAAATSSISGQKGTILEIDGYDQVPLVGDAIGFSTTYGGDSLFYIVNTVTNVAAAVTYTDTVGAAHTFFNRATLTISPEKSQGTPDTRNITGAGSTITVRTRFSQVRLTGHDFLSVGTGNKTETNYPDVDETQIIQGNETNTFGPGKVFFVSTDQGGNFRVGQFFSVDQLTGRATLDASAFNLSGLTELRLGAIGGQVGEAINEFSSDEFMSGDSNTACPTEFAVKGFVTRGKMGVGAMVPPVGTTAQRPSGVDPSFVLGAFRFNTTLGALEYYDGTAWTQPGKLQYVTQSTSANALPGHVYFINTTTGQVQMTLPASPSIGDTIRFYDAAKTFDTNALVVARNGKTIMGDSSDLTVTVEGASFELTFQGDTYGWRLFSI
ncbi:MAG: hypothetical protein CMG17_07000 [Candidatus Marinimicrobia bacterium]|jgi:hypothetical protein|nr:hypothetical protein [Candidatus Neomarinimicrobiota bacterium]